MSLEKNNELLKDFIKKLLIFYILYILDKNDDDFN